MSFSLNNLFLTIINPGTFLLVVIVILSLYFLVIYAMDNNNNYRKQHINIMILLFVWIIVVSGNLIYICHQKYSELSQKQTNEKETNQNFLDRTIKYIHGFDPNNALVILFINYIKAINDLFPLFLL